MEPATSSYVSQRAFNDKFGWPLNGEVVGKFGSLQDLVLLKGVVIESKLSDHVLAAGDGKAVLVDQTLKGYGKTIIVEHSDVFSTVYAKNSEILVFPGQRVRRGDLIARAGRADRGAGSRVYFELRKNLKAEDPLLYLEKF
jgi:septal ring factor EnvC (AmiA/AmiB activator)